MKQILLILMLTITASCKKADIPQPVKKEISITLFSASPYNGKVIIHFSVSGATDVAYYKIFSGTTGNFLCTISQIKNVATETNYVYKDLHPKGNPTYYMLAYMSNDSTLTFNGQLLKVYPSGK